MNPADIESALKLEATQRLEDAFNSLQAAVRQRDTAPDDLLAATWLEAARIEAEDALAVGDEWDLR